MKTPPSRDALDFLSARNTVLPVGKISLLGKDATNSVFQQQPLASQCLEGSGDPELQIESLDLEFSAFSENVLTMSLQVLKLTESLIRGSVRNN